MKEHLTDKDLMIYVERIVRPVRALQRRKLQMRMELLAHLQLSLDEERERLPGDERAAFQRAKLRLGEAAALTRNLQQTVPLYERLLFARIPMSRRLEDWEQQSASVLHGKCGEMTLGHITILSFTAMLAGVPLFCSACIAVKKSGMEVTHKALLLIVLTTGWIALLRSSYRLVFAVASPDAYLDKPGMWMRSAAVFALQIGLSFFATFTIADRAPMIGEILICATCTISILAVSIMIARRVAVARRPYDEWLTLSIAAEI